MLIKASIRTSTATRSASAGTTEVTEAHGFSSTVEAGNGVIDKLLVALVINKLLIRTSST